MYSNDILVQFHDADNFLPHPGALTEPRHALTAVIYGAQSQGNPKPMEPDGNASIDFTELCLSACRQVHPAASSRAGWGGEELAAVCQGVRAGRLCVPCHPAQQPGSAHHTGTVQFLFFC